eukprot:TRINITY_DN87980_c0_g1_i1.p1 TRINITY_DN87980_c0_g1~~TRINITY_DN87980_c0_g1_i1.p1  ORF type:complete len:1103 (+),score=305.75 TRINITY_DN87980_c0_g1_i1:1763-5071(+)
MPNTSASTVVMRLRSSLLALPRRVPWETWTGVRWGMARVMRKKAKQPQMVGGGTDINSPSALWRRSTWPSCTTLMTIPSMPRPSPQSSRTRWRRTSTSCSALRQSMVRCTLKRRLSASSRVTRVWVESLSAWQLESATQAIRSTFRRSPSGRVTSTLAIRLSRPPCTMDECTRPISRSHIRGQHSSPRVEASSRAATRMLFSSQVLPFFRARRWKSSPGDSKMAISTGNRRRGLAGKPMASHRQAKLRGSWARASSREDLAPPEGPERWHISQWAMAQTIVSTTHLGRIRELQPGAGNSRTRSVGPASRSSSCSSTRKTLASLVLLCLALLKNKIPLLVQGHLHGPGGLVSSGGQIAAKGLGGQGAALLQDDPRPEGDQVALEAGQEPGAQAGGRRDALAGQAHPLGGVAGRGDHRPLQDPGQGVPAQGVEDDGLAHSAQKGAREQLLDLLDHPVLHLLGRGALAEAQALAHLLVRPAGQVHGEEQDEIGAGEHGAGGALGLAGLQHLQEQIGQGRPHVGHGVVQVADLHHAAGVMLGHLLQPAGHVRHDDAPAAAQQLAGRGVEVGHGGRVYVYVGHPQLPGHQHGALGLSRGRGALGAEPQGLFQGPGERLHAQAGEKLPQGALLSQELLGQAAQKGGVAEHLAVALLHLGRAPGPGPDAEAAQGFGQAAQALGESRAARSVAGSAPTPPAADRAGGHNRKYSALLARGVLRQNCPQLLADLVPGGGGQASLQFAGPMDREIHQRRDLLGRNLAQHREQGIVDRSLSAVEHRLQLAQEPGEDNRGSPAGQGGQQGLDLIAQFIGAAAQAEAHRGHHQRAGRLGGQLEQGLAVGHGRDQGGQGGAALQGAGGQHRQGQVQLHLVGRGDGQVGRALQELHGLAGPLRQGLQGTVLGQGPGRQVLQGALERLVQFREVGGVQGAGEVFLEIAGELVQPLELLAEGAGPAQGHGAGRHPQLGPKMGPVPLAAGGRQAHLFVEPGQLLEQDHRVRGQTAGALGQLDLYNHDVFRAHGGGKGRDAAPGPVRPVAGKAVPSRGEGHIQIQALGAQVRQLGQGLLPAVAGPKFALRGLLHNSSLWLTAASGRRCPCIEQVLCQKRGAL